MVRLRRVFVRLLRTVRLILDKNWQPPVASVDDSLAKTARDALHVRGRSGFFRVGVSSTSKVYDLIAEGHKNYAKSFKKKG